MSERITLGRSPQCDISTGDKYNTVSFEHADIELSNGVLVFIDHSTNGTMINGKLYKGQSVTINKNDEILLANVYPLDWKELLNFFPSLRRRTVLAEYIDGGEPVDNSATKVMPPSPAPAPAPAPVPASAPKQKDINSSRETQDLNHILENAQNSDAMHQSQRETQMQVSANSAAQQAARQAVEKAKAMSNAENEGKGKKKKSKKQKKAKSRSKGKRSMAMVWFTLAWIVIILGVAFYLFNDLIFNLF